MPLQSIQVVAICTVTEFLCSVSHCSDNVTHPLNQNDDTGSSTDEYEWDDGDSTHSPVADSSNTTPSASGVARGGFGGSNPSH